MTLGPLMVDVAGTELTAEDRRDGVLRLQRERAERPHLQPEARAVGGGTRGPAERPQRQHRQPPLGSVVRRADQEQQDVLLRELRGLERQGHLRRRPGHLPHRGHAGGRLLRGVLQAQGSADRPELPRERHPGRPPQPPGPGGHQPVLTVANAGTLSTGYGVFQQFVPITRKRHRADLRIDHELSPKDSLFLRGSYQWRDPSSVTFEAGNALTNMPILKAELKTGALVGGWTKIFSPTVVNELRIGYNNDNSVRQSNYVAEDVNRELGLETAPSLVGTGKYGFASFAFTGLNRSLNIVDQARNVDRTVKGRLLGDRYRPSRSPPTCLHDLGCAGQSHA